MEDQGIRLVANTGNSFPLSSLKINTRCIQEIAESSIEMKFKSSVATDMEAELG